MTAELTTKEAVRSFADAVNGTHYADARIVLTRQGKPVAALVPLADLAQLEAAKAAPAQREENHGK